METRFEIQRKGIVPLLFCHFEKRCIELLRANAPDDIDQDVDFAETLQCDAGHFRRFFRIDAVGALLDNLTLRMRGSNRFDCFVEPSARYVRQH